MNTNNNPCNVKWADPDDSTQLWHGSTGYDDRGHAVFEDPADGIRSTMRNLQQYGRAGHRTPLAICQHWAPAADTIGSIPGRPQNDPREYAAYVAARAKIGLDDELPNPDTANATSLLLWARVISAMARFEMGEDCPWLVILEGLARWRRDFCDRAEIGREAPEK